MSYKARMTDTHFYFLNGPCSQWHSATFYAPIVKNSPVVYPFNCCEQYMMARKALLFNDISTFDKIMQVQPKRGELFYKVPKEQKKLGRDVFPFDPVVWNKECDEIVFEGNLGKFTQNIPEQEYLLKIGERIIVEGSQSDRIWGAGVDWNNPKIEDEENWTGANRLGKALMRVSVAIRAKKLSCAV